MTDLTAHMKALYIGFDRFPTIANLQIVLGV